MIIAFFGIFVYGLLAALPGSVLPTLERNQFLPSDSAVGTFLLINAVGAVLAYAVSGPIIDRIGTKVALLVGSVCVIGSLIGFALIVTRVAATSALILIFGCSLVLGFGANAIVASGHALVAEVAVTWRNSVLNLLDICFGLGLASLPLVVQALQRQGGLELIFWSLGALTVVLLLLIVTSRFPAPTQSHSAGTGEAVSLFTNPSFLLLAAALFMYVGAEVSVGKWVVTFMERDANILASQGVSAAHLDAMGRMSPDVLNKFFEADPVGVGIAGYALRTLSLFALALLIGRLVSSLLLGVLRVNSVLLMTVGSLLTTVSLVIAFTANSSGTVRVGLIAAGFGMGPIFPTSVGLASVMNPRIAGTAMSWVMGVGFAGLLVIPPAVGYVSSAVGGSTGNVRTGLTAVIIASVVMLLLHALLLLKQRGHTATVLIISTLACLLVFDQIRAADVAVEQTSPGARSAAQLVESFDGLGFGFEGPQGKANLRNPSDNTIAIGPDHIVQIVNSRMAVFSKKGKRFEATGKILYGPVVTNAVFAGFGGQCEARNNGDAVVRYDQLAHRWLIVMPIFARGPVRPDQPAAWKSGDAAQSSPPGRPNQPGAPFKLVPPPVPNPTINPNRAAPATQGQGPFSICYAVSTSDDPLGEYYRYEFLRPLFPDYPRPAVWPDGYYVPTSTGDNVIQKHACVVERDKMLKGLPATEQCLVVDGVNFLNNADLDGFALPPRGAPNIVLAAGGTQLNKILEDDGVYAWNFHVDWKNPANTKLIGPTKIAVAPYQYLCGGQLTNCVPQPDSETKLDAQGDKIMARVVYRKLNGHESLVAVHSVNTSAGGGGVRWYEFRLDQNRAPKFYQQGTYAPDKFYRWMASPAMDRFGNIGIGYSFGGTPNFAGQRFAGRLANDPLGQLTLREIILAEGEAAQSAMRWEDYTQTAVDPSDDCTIWYVGDYLKKNAANYSSRIGAFRFPGCSR